MLRASVLLLAAFVAAPLALAHPAQEHSVLDRTAWVAADAQPVAGSGLHLTFGAGSDNEVAPLALGAHGDCGFAGTPSQDDVSLYCPYMEVTGPVAAHPILLCSAQPQGRTGCGAQTGRDPSPTGAGAHLHEAAGVPRVCASAVVENVPVAWACVVYDQTLEPTCIVLDHRTPAGADDVRVVCSPLLPELPLVLP